MNDFYLLPPIIQNDEGKTRTVGFEIEFAAEDPLEVAEKIKDIFGGSLQTINAHYYKILKSKLGDFSVQLDTQLVHPGKPSEDQLDESELERFLKYEAVEKLCEVVGDISKSVVPYEVITDAISLDRLNELDALVDGLKELDVKGTDEAFVFAFGVHINPEVPSLKVESILNHLRAFLLLSDWLHESIDVDVARKISPYINSFPESYCLKIMNCAYQPDLNQFIEDYLSDNPTRNRELDLLPLFTFLDREKVEKELDDDLTSARPTFHYRLPDSRLNDPNWSLRKEWNLWVQVERLAHNTDLLQELSLKYIDHFDQLLPGPWIEEIRDAIDASQ